MAVTLPRRLRYVLLAVGGIAVLIGGLALYDYVRINLWIDHDAGRIANYPYPLIQDQRPVALRSEGAVRRIELLLLAELRGGRNVVNMSRSEIKYNLLGTRAYTKVFLETAAPDKLEVRSRLVALCEFVRGVEGWKLDKAVEKTQE